MWDTKTNKKDHVLRSFLLTNKKKLEQKKQWKLLNVRHHHVHHQDQLFKTKNKKDKKLYRNNVTEKEKQEGKKTKILIELETSDLLVKRINSNVNKSK